MPLIRKDPVLPIVQAPGEPVQVAGFNPTAEKIARLDFERLGLGDLPVVQVDLDETETASASSRRAPPE